MPDSLPEAVSRPANAAPAAWVLTEPLAGLTSQAVGLAERTGLDFSQRFLKRRFLYRFLAPSLWPRPLAAVEPSALAPPVAPVVIGCGGGAAVVAADLRHFGCALVQIQHPRIDPHRFDLIIAARHDEISGANVFITRTALHRVTPQRLASAAFLWGPRLAHLPRPLVAVLVGGAHGHYRLGASEAERLAYGLAAMMRRDRVGVALTPSRRTDLAVRRIFAEALTPLGAWVWDGQGENPYFGLLALADAIVCTIDSVSMISEAAATSAPILLAALPGHSRRQRRFLEAMTAAGRAREFTGRFVLWPVAPMDDTDEAAAEVRRRLGL